MNNGGPVAKIIERNGWKTKMDFVGHRKAVTCVVGYSSCVVFLSSHSQLVFFKIGDQIVDNIKYFLGVPIFHLTEQAFVQR